MTIRQTRSGESTSSQNEGLSSDAPFRQRRPPFVLLMAVLCFAILFLKVASIAEEEGDTVEHVQVRTKGLERNDESDGQCLGLCSARSKSRQEQFQGDLLNRDDLLNMVHTAKDKLVAKVKEDYGQYFEMIFMGDNKSFQPITSNGKSMEKLKRRLMIKVLEVQTNLMEQEKNVADICDCSEAGRALVKEIQSLGPESLHVPKTYSRYVFAVGGHSSAAGHGNLFNESYAASMGRDARMVFEAIGIEFEDRNYAMGGTSSASEISMCWEQIFGSDVDFVSWDYGMTDGNYVQRLMHYGYRAALTPGRPALLGMRVGGRSRRSREGVLLELEQMGMPVFYGKDEAYEARNRGVPDSAGLTKSEIDTLPPFVRNFKCGDQFEKGDPFCGVEKFSKDICSPRSKQTGWHPGYKSHALDGHALGLFMVNALVEAVTDLSKHENTDPVALLAELRSQEDETYEAIRNTTIPDANLVSLYLPPNNGGRDPELDVVDLWKGPSICRTARLPAQSRYLGVTTNSNKVGGIAILGKEEFDVGYSTGSELDAASKSGLLNLAYDPNNNDRERCEVILKPDYKDFFYTQNGYGKSKLTIPNEKEKQAYRFHSSQYKGLLVLVFISCDWGKCHALDSRPEKYPDHTFEITVNGKVVKELIPMGFDAWALKGEDGLYWQVDSNGAYEVGFEVHAKYAFLKLSSIILY